MSQQPPSGWNSFFHRDQAYDTTYNNNNNTLVTEQPIRFSFFNYKQEQGGYNNYEGGMREVKGDYGDVEKSTNNNPGDPSFWKTSGSEPNPYGSEVMPSAPPESPDMSTTFDRERVDSDEEIARRIYREEQENYMRYSQGSTKQIGGTSEYQRPGEADSYYAAGRERDSSNVQVGIQGLPTDSRVPKAYQDPKVQQQLFKKKLWKPYFTYLVTLIQLAIFIYEFIYNQKQTGSPIQTRPFNPLIGPTAPTLIQLGARYVPCMKNVPSLNEATLIMCDPNNSTKTCSLEELCGLGGFKNGEPNQWFRFILPIFLHGGVVHFLFNMIFQVQTGKQVESDMGWWRYGIIYMASGIFGFIFGGNFSEVTLPSMGASGSLFGIVGILFLDLLQNWKLVYNPCWELTKMILLIAFSFAFGLLPAIDNFSHIGGFVMGIVMGLILMPTVNFSRNHKRLTWGLRILAVPLAIIMFVLLIRNFYGKEDPAKACSWCKYLDCLPIENWCDITGLQNTTVTTNP